MYLLYVDESGNENDPNDRYFVLGGLAVFERSTFFLTKAIEEVQDRHFPNHQPIPFHESTGWCMCGRTRPSYASAPRASAARIKAAPGRGCFKGGK